MPSSGFLLRRNMVPRLGAVRNRELAAGRNGSVTAPDRFPVNGFGRRAAPPAAKGSCLRRLGLARSSASGDGSGAGTRAGAEAKPGKPSRTAQVPGNGVGAAATSAPERSP